MKTHRSTLRTRFHGDRIAHSRTNPCHSRSDIATFKNVFFFRHRLVCLWGIAQPYVRHGAK